MLAESFVAIMAMIAACVLDPGVYFAMNSPAAVCGRRHGGNADDLGVGISGDGAIRWRRWRRRWASTRCSTGREERRRSRWGWRTFFRGRWADRALMGIWYHFAIMFEALFILTVLDAGTRVGRFMLQDALGHVWKPLGKTSWYPSVVLTSGVDRGALGILSVGGSEGPVRRHQFDVAAVRNLEPTAGDGGAVRARRRSHQVASSAICLRDARFRSAGWWRSRSRRRIRRCSTPIRGSGFFLTRDCLGRSLCSWDTKRR